MTWYVVLTTIEDDVINVVQVSADQATYLELLTDRILSHWEPLRIDEKAIVLDDANRYQGKAETGFMYYF
jgi:hypothetical protein